MPSALKKSNKNYLFFVLLLVILFSYLDFSFAKNQSSQKTSALQENEKEETILQNPSKTDYSLKESVKKVIDNIAPSAGTIGREDPFKSPFAVSQGSSWSTAPIKKAPAKKACLVAVFEAERAEAIIEFNGKSFTVYEGSSIAGRKVKNISQEEVILTKGQKVYILPLGKPVPLD
jgi:hypothetical protein